MAIDTKEATPGSIKNSRMNLTPGNSRLTKRARARAIAVLPGTIMAAYFKVFPRETHKSSSANRSLKFLSPTNCGGASRVQSVKANPRDATIGISVNIVKPSRLGARNKLHKGHHASFERTFF